MILLGVALCLAGFACIEAVRPGRLWLASAGWLLLTLGVIVLLGWLAWVAGG